MEIEYYQENREYFKKYFISIDSVLFIKFISICFIQLCVCVIVILWNPKNFKNTIYACNQPLWKVWKCLRQFW